MAPPEIMDERKTSLNKGKELKKSKNYCAAKDEVTTGLEKATDKFNPLIIATDVYHKSGDLEKSLEYSELLITHHPDNWNGYGRATQNLILLKSFEQAQEKIRAGLEKIPNQVNLLIIATDAYHKSGDSEKSLEYA